MQLSVALFLAISAAVLVSSHPIGEDQDSSKVAADSSSLVREKRTIGILRDLFPNFSQMIDRKIQMLTRFIFRIVGRLVLQGGAGGGGGGGGDDDDRRVQITLPTYPPDELEDEDEDSTGTTTTSDSEATTNADAENSVGESRKREVRAKREAEEEEEEEDLESEATGDNEVTSDNEAEGTNGDGEAADEDDPRNKRFLNFNLGASASTGGSGGGSGNFLFDIIRLVAGSGNTQSGDAQHAALEEGKDDAAYGVGVPGPLTRLFVVANKGVAALVQDLILRLAQTSERIVNFKARLITSII